MMNSNKVEIIQMWFEFKNFRELQVFLKFANFYKRFVKFYVKIIRFLTKLFKKSKKKNKANYLFLTTSQDRRFDDLLKRL